VTFASQLSTSFTPIAAVYDDPSVAQALSLAQSAVVNYCNQTFDLITSDVVYLDPKPRRTALLPQVPVANIDSVMGLLPPSSSTESGLTWTTLTNYRFVSDTGLLYDTTGEPGVIWPIGPSWPWLPGSLQVTYDHGWSTVPQDVVNVACGLAQQYLENPVWQLQRRVGDIEDRFAGSIGVVIPDMAKRILDRYTDIGIA
jgi:hypothetical protein